MNHENICKQTIELVKETALFIKNQENKISFDDIQNKGQHDFVTYVDKGSEKLLVEGLSKILPGSGFITEEGTNNQKGEYNWVIDPLDGTTNFIHKLPPYAISIGLLHNNTLEMGIVHEICLNECFYAWKDSKAYLNEKEIHVSKVNSVSNAFIATGFPYIALERIEPFMKTLEFFFKNSPGVRRLGSAATDMAYVACGRFDAFYEYNLNPWDVAGGAFIIQQAGGYNSDFFGKDNYIFGKEIISTNGSIHKDFLEIIKKFMIHKDYK